MIVPVPLTDPTTQLNLEPGFRFCPTDEELIVQYLYPKVAGKISPLLIIGDVDLYKFDPWELPSKAMFGEKEWYFFSPRDRKYPNGDRPNRVVGSGYWKATGTDKVIMSGNQTLGIKKALVFYVGKAKKGYKTDWIMHEYRLPESSTKDKSSSRLDDWVVCRIYVKNSNTQKRISSGPSIEQGHYSPEVSSSSSPFDNILNSHPATLPEIEDKSLNTQTNHSMSPFDEKNQKFDNQKFNAESDDWMSVRGFAYPNQINNDNPPNSTSVDPIFNTKMKFVELLELPYDEVQTTMLPSLFNTTDPFAIRYPTHPSSSSGYIP